MSTICITGGTTGIGYEAALQLARGAKYDKIIITSRKEASAKEAIAKLVTDSNQPETKFGFVLLDLNSIASCTACAESLPNDLNAIVLNAGQMAVKGYADVNAKTGLTLTWTETVLGHSILITLLLEKKKFAKGARVIYSGSEVVRNIWGFTGLQPTPKFHLKDIESYPSKPPSGLIAARACLAVYGNAKMFMTMFMKTLAEENKDIYFATVSPGGVATTFYVGMPQPLRFVGAYGGCLMRCMNIMHTTEKGAKRYVDAVTEENFPTKWPTGSFLASPSGLTTLGGAGPLTDQANLNSALGNKDIQKEVARVIRIKMSAATDE